MKQVLVIGESCRDLFVYCNTLRLCPDVPVPVLNVQNQTENGGMAKNVQRNIESYIPGCDLITNSDWYNITKTRYIHDASNHMFFRVDTPHIIPRINMEDITFDYDLVVVSDYNKGFLLKEDIALICNSHPNVFLDTKKVLGPWANNAAYIKINDYEYQNSRPYITPKLANKIIHTTGANGCEFGDKLYPVNVVDVKDTSGAGDSFMAALVVEYCRSADIEESIKFANKCASEVVKQKGVSVI
jgi:bifunctional ADP-heptose synthase (sugar kinase/adenylyltransferase)